MDFTERDKHGRPIKLVDDWRPKVAAIMNRLGSISEKLDTLETSVQYNDTAKHAKFVEDNGDISLSKSSLVDLKDFLSEYDKDSFFEIPYDDNKMVFANYDKNAEYPIQWIMGGKLYGKNTDGIVSKGLDSILSAE